MRLEWIISDLQGERATGYGVALLLVLFGYLSTDEHLKYLCPNKVAVISSSGETGSSTGPSNSKKQKTKWSSLYDYSYVRTSIYFLPSEFLRNDYLGLIFIYFLTVPLNVQNIFDRNFDRREKTESWLRYTI